MVRGADVGPGGRIGGWDCSAVRIASKGHTAPAVARSSRARPFVGESMRLVREPDAGDLHVRFDERDVETELRRGYSGTARRKGRQQTNRTYCHRATSRLYRLRRPDARRRPVGRKSGVLGAKGSLRACSPTHTAGHFRSSSTTQKAVQTGHSSVGADESRTSRLQLVSRRGVSSELKAEQRKSALLSQNRLYLRRATIIGASSARINRGYASHVRHPGTP